MNTYSFYGTYTMSVNMEIEADSFEEAKEIAEDCGGAITTEWTGNSVFVDESSVPDGVIDMTLEADGTLMNIDSEDFDEFDESFRRRPIARRRVFESKEIANRKNFKEHRNPSVARKFRRTSRTV